jgi:putative transposase
MCKDAAIKRHGNRLVLSNRWENKNSKIKFPTSLPLGKIVAVELGFRELRITISNAIAKPVSAGDNMVAADVGVIHLAVMTDGVVSEAIVGRGLRTLVRWKTKASLSFRGI